MTLVGCSNDDVYNKPWVILQLGVELARGAALLALTSITSSVTALTVATVATATTTERSAALLVTEHAARGGVGPLLLDVRGRNDLGRQVEPLSEVVKTLGGEGVVVCCERLLVLIDHVRLWYIFDEVSQVVRKRAITHSIARRTES